MLGPPETRALSAIDNMIVWVAGTVGAAGSSVLLAIDDAHFGSAGVSMDGNVVLVYSKDATNTVAAIAGEC